MSFNPRQLLRMARWARHPPGEKRVMLVLTVLALALAIWGLERVFGTPAWMQIDGSPPGRVSR